MTSIYGRVQSVSTINAGDTLRDEVLADAIMLPVEDVSNFDPDGGMVLVGSVQIVPYDGIDEDADAILLVGPLGFATEEGTRVEIYPPAPEKVALVDLGDDGDNISVTVPQSLVPLLRDGFREPGREEAVLIVERAAGEWVVADVPSAVAEVGGAHVADGQVSPAKLTTGLVTNLVVDPSFLGGEWPTADRWEIRTDPTGDFPGIGYLRCFSSTLDNVVQPGSTAADSTYFLTDWNQVKTEDTIRVSLLVRASAAAILPDVEARVRVALTGPSVPDLFSLDELLLSVEATGDVWQGLTGNFQVPEGYTAFRAFVQTTNQTAGTIDFIKPEVQVVWNRVQSVNYVEGESGFNFDDENAQVQNLNVTGAIGAQVVSTSALDIDGVDVSAMLDEMPDGAVGFGSSASGSNAGNVGTTRIPLFAYNMGEVTPGRFYRIHVRAHFQCTDPAAYDLDIQFTTDGSDPAVGGTRMNGSLTRVNFTSGYTGTLIEPFDIWVYYAPGGPWDVRMKLFAQRVSGSGVGWIPQEQISRQLIWNIEDMGTRSGANLGVLAQKKTGGGEVENPTPPPVQDDPISTYTRTWWATDSRSYDSDDGTRNGDDGNRCYQGYISGTHGNTKSLVFFDHASIRSALSGATIKKVELIFKPQHVWANSGITVVLNSHNHSSKPSNFGDSLVNKDRHRWSSIKEGVTYTKTLSNSIGDELKAGTTKGIGFGPAPSNSASAYYGYMYGGGSSSSRPRLRITFSK